MKQVSIQKIENLKGEYEPSNFSDFDELQASESLDGTKRSEDNTVLNNYYPKDNVSVLDENANDSCRPKEDLTLTESKKNAILELTKCNYLTPPIKVSRLLEQLFISYPSKKDHWLYIAQAYSPRTINRVIARMNKYHKSGGKVLKPPALFTHLIQFRKKRKTSNLFSPEELRIKNLRKQQGDQKQKSERIGY